MRLEVVIPNYIREIQLSNSQRPIYYEWDEITNNVRAKNKALLQRYVKDSEAVKHNNGKVSIDNISNDYCIGIFHKNKLIGEYNNICEARYYNNVKSYSYQKNELKYRLIDKQSKDLIIANPNQVGQPNIKAIKGQDIYTGGEYIRAAVISEIKKSFTSYVKNLPVITEFPLKITLEIHDSIKAWTDNSLDEVGKAWDVDNRGYPYCKAFPDLLIQLGKIPDDDRLRITQPPHPVFVPIKEHETRKLVFIIEKDNRICIVNNPIYNGTQVRERVIKNSPKLLSRSKKKKLIQTIKFNK
jgi:hypothetical protein